MAFTRAMTQVLCLTKFFNKIGLSIKSPIKIRADNNRLISNSINNKNHRCTKHINMKHYFVKEYTTQGEVFFKYIPSLDNLIDIFTKSLSHDTIWKLIMYLTHKNPPTMMVQGEC